MTTQGDIVRSEAGTHAYDGLCSICGSLARFVGYAVNARASFHCPSCGANHLYREQASAILTCFARGKSHFLSHFSRQPECRALNILEYALASPFVRQLRTLPSYRHAYDVSSVDGPLARHGMLDQRLEELAVADEELDLLLTSDILEHVFDVEAVVAEARRVLRPGGAHIFTVPLASPLPHTTITRARMNGNSVEHLEEARWEYRPYDEPSLVVRDFGADLIDLHASHGLHARFFRAMPMSDILQGSAVVIARKLT